MAATAMPAHDPTLSALAEATYVSLRTFRRDGLGIAPGLHRLLDRPLAARYVVRLNERSIGTGTAAQPGFRMAHERLD